MFYFPVQSPCAQRAFVCAHPAFTRTLRFAPFPFIVHSYFKKKGILKSDVGNHSHIAPIPTLSNIKVKEYYFIDKRRNTYSLLKTRSCLVSFFYMLPNMIYYYFIYYENFFSFIIFSSAYKHFIDIIQSNFSFIHSHIHTHIYPNLAVVAFFNNGEKLI